MALTILETNVVLDLYDHDGTRPQIKSIALDDNTRYVFARLTYKGQTYDIGSDATVKLIIIRPDKVGAQVIGETKVYEDYNEDETVSNVYGAYAELDQPAIAVAGTLLGQFVITSGDQILRSQIFAVNNGEALDADEWAGQYDGYNLDELVERVDEAVSQVEDMEEDVAELKSGFSELYNSTYVTDSASGAVSHFVDGADDVHMKSLKVAIEPVQSGSGDPSPDNVRPISGWDTVKVTRTGKNLVKPLSKTESGLTLTPQSDGGVLINGTYTGATGWFVISTNVRLKAGQTYTLSLSGMEIAYGMNGYGSSNPVTPNADFVSNFHLRVENGQTFNNVLVYAQVEAGATATDFEAGVSDSYNISLSSTGTVYGGTLDVVSGVLTVDRMMKTIEGNESAWGNTDSYNTIYSVNFSDMVDKGVHNTKNIITNMGFVVCGYNYSAMNNYDYSICIRADESNKWRIYLRTPNTSLDALKTWLASHNLQVVYPLAIPITYNLTPTEVKSLLGINNIWSDAGDVEVEYRADTKLYIDKRLAEVTA